MSSQSIGHTPSFLRFFPFIGRLIIVLMIGYVGLATPVAAAKPEQAEDLLSDSRASTPSKHTFTVNMTSGTAFEAGETFSFTFPADFTLPGLTTSDVSFNDGTTRTVVTPCAAGANNVGLGISGQVITLTACSGYTPSTAGAVVVFVVGTGSTFITNPASTVVYVIEIAGSYGDDAQGVAVAITSGATLSATVPSPTGNVRFTGDAFPAALVTILDGGAVAGNTVANSTSFFDKTITGLSPTTHTFGVYGQSLDGRKTLTISFNVNVISGSTITVSGILLPPILSVPSSAKRPATFPQSGLARHNSTVTTFTNSHNAINRQTTTNANGEWQITISDVLHLGGHTTSGLVNDGNGNQSILTDVKSFEILLSADLNVDNLISLTDFSMLMFNYGTSNPQNKAADINDNGPVDLVDFSVMMFYWTGG